MSDFNKKTLSNASDVNSKGTSGPFNKENNAEKSVSASKNQVTKNANSDSSVPEKPFSGSQTKEKRKSHPYGAISKRSRSNSRDRSFNRERMSNSGYPGAINFETEDHFIFVDQAWPQELMDSAEGINFISRPNTCLSDIANEIVSVIHNRNPDKRTYITASIFNNFIEAYKPEGIMQIVEKISAHIKDPCVTWIKHRHDPDAEPMPSIFKVFLTYPTLPYIPTLEYMWPEIADLNQWLKNETLSLQATPFNFSKWITKQAKENCRQRETRGSMYVEYNNGVEGRNNEGLGTTLTYDAKRNVTNHLVIHHITGVRNIRDMSINNEEPPVPLVRTGGYQMVETNRTNAWIYKHMGAMDAKIAEYNRLKVVQEEEKRLLQLSVEQEKQRLEEERQHDLLRLQEEQQRQAEQEKERQRIIREEEIAREKMLQEKERKERERNPEYLLKVIQQKDRDFIEMKEAKGRASNSLGQMTDNFLNLRTKHQKLEKEHEALKVQCNKAVADRNEIFADYHQNLKERDVESETLLQYTKELVRLEGVTRVLREENAALKQKHVKMELNAALQKQKASAEKKKENKEKKI